jgi:hypothetical protein
MATGYFNTGNENSTGKKKRRKRKLKDTDEMKQPKSEQKE